ncbi:MAG: competence/damage-inducible protein A [Oscillospiraceae bacterium]|jgi:nicotinamide-nucleotide amidase|nr:competence/damage-inducible protein A [Oscillospiraceae bacterium]
MVVELIAVGTELLLGNTANTDAQDLSQELSELGLHVYFHTVVGDNPGRLTQALQIAKERSDILITTGGLGPTYDDLTKETIAACFGRKLVRHEEIWTRIRTYFDGVRRPLTPNNERQAYLPEGCVIFQNDWGTAPGCAFETGGKHVLMLPGPPRECLSMFRHCARLYLEKFSKESIVSRQVRIFGMGEAAVEDKLRAYMERQENPTVAPYAKEGEVMLRVTARAATSEAARAMTEPVVGEICRVLGDVVYGVDVDSLEARVSALLREQGKTLALAESCTGGLIAGRLTEIPGASQVFRGGAVAYSNAAKAALLGVSERLLGLYGAVSEPVALAMARGALVQMNADVAAAVTGLAGPDGDGSGTAPGTVCLALAARDAEPVTRTLLLGTDRRRVRVAASGHALDMVRRHLLGL